MLRFLIILFILSALFRRPWYGGFPFFMGGWGYRRPPMGGFRGGPRGWF